MTTPDIQQARDWANWLQSQRDLFGEKSQGARAAALTIQSLPDQIVDGDKLRQIIDFQGTSISEEARKDLESLIPTPPLPTLADLTRGLDKDIEQYRWMQAEVFHTGERGAITDFNLYAETATVLFPNGVMKNVPWEDITPLPGEPKMEWPGSAPDDVAYATGGALTTQDVVDECRAVRKERALPRPEDVPAGEAWLILRDGHKWVAARESGEKATWPWSLARLDGADYGMARDSAITLVSRLVPDHKENA